MDVETIERIESELDAFIEKRAREAKDAAKVEEAWKESERAHRQRQREENRLAWREFYLNLANAHEAHASRHREKAAALSNGEGDAVA